MKSDALNFKILPDPLIEVDITRENIAPNGGWRTTFNGQRSA